MALHRKPAWPRLVARLKVWLGIAGPVATATAHDRQQGPEGFDPDRFAQGFRHGIDEASAALHRDRHSTRFDEDLQRFGASLREAVRDQASGHADQDAPEAFQRSPADGGIVAAAGGWIWGGIRWGEKPLDGSEPLWRTVADTAHQPQAIRGGIRWGEKPLGGGKPPSWEDLVTGPPSAVRLRRGWTCATG